MGVIEHLFEVLNNESLFCLKIKEKKYMHVMQGNYRDRKILIKFNYNK